MSVLLGCIADDFTGATDLANTLTRQGMATVVLLGLPPADFAVADADAVVIALKSRSIPAGEAVRASLDALAWLRRAGAVQFYFKYCSTFDSTASGNIGPVGEALLDALGESFTVACPAFPTNQRTVYGGYLFVGDQLLSESSMKDHPLTPMRDPSLVRVLRGQSKGRVTLIAFDVVDRGVDAIGTAILARQFQKYRFAVVDALTDAHLVSIGRACATMKLLTGGSGLALALPENFRLARLLGRRVAYSLPAIAGPALVLAGSCSAATQRQVAAMKAQCEWLELDPFASSGADDLVAKASEWAKARLGAAPVLIYSTAGPEKVAQLQAQLGRERAGEMIEKAFAQIARRLVEAGVRRLVVAGGETSGAVVTALGIQGLRVGAEIDPGVPWTASLSDRPLALALKSGNFGSDDFFIKAFGVLKPPPPFPSP